MSSPFSGIGLLDLGLAWAGMRTVGLCEIEPYLAEHPGVPTNALRKAVRLGKDTLPEVLASLERSGQVDSCPGARKSTLWFLASDRGRFEGREEG